MDSDGPGAGAATLKTRFLLGDAVDQVLAQETVTGNEVLWLLQDNLGSVRETVKNDGTVNSRVDFDPFGNMVSIIDPSSGGAATTLKTRLNFTGQEWDADLKLIWYSDGTGRGRWYDPATGTFINQDALGFAAGDANLYRYVENGATYAVDPSGLVTALPAIPKVNPGHPLAPWKPIIAAPTSNNTSCASNSARAMIRSNIMRLKQDLVNKIYQMLTQTPPIPSPGKPTATNSDLRDVANVVADAYIRAVDKFLENHVGAKPQSDRRWFWQDDKSAPWCADWAEGMTTAMMDELAHGPESDIIGIDWGQFKGGGYEHNFLIIRPRGYQTKWNTADPNILILDPWRHLLPEAFWPANCSAQFPTGRL